MKPLYEISFDYQRLVSQLVDSDEITDEQMELLNQINDDVNNKVVNVAAFIRNLESEVESIEKAIDLMVKRSHAATKKVEKLKEYLKTNMVNCNITEVKSPYFNIKVKVNPAHVVIQDEKLIPEKYKTQINLTKIDKYSMMNDLKNNVIIPGVILERKSRIDIR